MKDKYGLTFVKCYDGTSNTYLSYIVNYLSGYSDLKIIMEYIRDSELSLADDYDLIEDTTKGTDFICTKLYPQMVYTLMKPKYKPF